VLKKLLNTTSLKANIIANFAGNIWSSLIGIIFVPFYLKYIGAEAYGLIGIFASLQMVLSLLDSGLSITLNKELSRLSVLPHTHQQMRNLVKTLGSVYWGVAVLAGVIALGLAPFLASSWVQPKDLSVQTITYAFALLSISVVFQFPAGFYSGGLLGLQRQVMLNIIRIVFATLRSAGGLLVLLYVSRDILAFFTWTLLINILQALVLKYMVWYYLPKSSARAVFDKQELKNIWRFAAGMTGIGITVILLTQVDKIILSKMLSLEQFGYYTIACSLGLMIYQIINPLTQSYFPRFSNLISLNNIEKLKQVYHEACQMVSVLVLPAAFILVFFSKELIFIWTGNKTTVENTWLVTAIYAFGTGINGLLNMPYQLTLAYGWTKLGFYQNIVLLCIMTPLTIFLAYHYGAVGGALSWATINILYFIVTPNLIHRKILKGEVLKWYWQDSVKPLLVCLIIIMAGKYLINIPISNRVVTLLCIGTIGILGVTGSVIFAKSIKPPMYSMLKKLKLKYF
jgi:O-antigen/teichoic acid export membrane protein